MKITHPAGCMSQFIKFFGEQILILWKFALLRKRICFFVSCFFHLHCKVKVKVTQSYPTLCDPMEYTVHGILQARILEWVAFPFSRGSSQPRDWTQVSHTGGGVVTSWFTRKAHLLCGLHIFPAPRMICRCEPGSVTSWLSSSRCFPLHRIQFEVPTVPPGYPSGLVSYCSRFPSRLLLFFEYVLSYLMVLPVVILSALNMQSSLHVLFLQLEYSFYVAGTSCYFPAPGIGVTR